MTNESISKRLIDAASLFKDVETEQHSNFESEWEAFKQLAEEVEERLTKAEDWDKGINFQLLKDLNFQKEREALWRELVDLYQSDIHWLSLQNQNYYRIKELRKQLGLE